MRHDEGLTQMARSAAVVAGVSAVTLLLTIAWQLLIARTFGTSRDLDAFWVALAIPRAIAESFHLGLLTLLFVIVFHRQHAGSPVGTKDEDRWRRSSAILNVTVAGTAIGMALLIGFASPLVRLMAPGLSAADLALSAMLLRDITLVLAPSAITAAIGGIAVARGDLLPFALARAAIPTLQIVTLLAVGVTFGVRVLVWALWIGAAGSMLIYVPWLRRAGFQYRFTLDLASPRTRSIVGLQSVLAAIWLLILLNQASDRFFASLLGAGSVSALEYAWRFEIPISQIVSLAVALPTFALLAQSASPDRRAAFRAALGSSARLLMLTVVPILGFLVVLREPLTRMWLEHGAFSAESARAVAGLVPSLSVVYFCRAFSSILVFGLLMAGRTRLLMAGLAAEVVLNTTLNLALSRLVGLPGITLASAISMTAVNAVLWARLLRETGGLRVRVAWLQARPVAVAGLVAIAGLEALRRGIGVSAPLDSGASSLLSLGFIGVAYLVLYIGACTGTGLIAWHPGERFPHFALRSIE
jgi:putative peptidoglycan lipid II flippase